MNYKEPAFRALLGRGGEKIPPLVLIYGDDTGAVKGLAADVAKTVVKDVNDPFLFEKIDTGQIVSEYSLLKNAADTLSFTGERKCVLLSASGDGGKAEKEALTQALLLCLENPPSSAVVVVAASGVDAKSALVKKVSAHKQAAVIRCFHDNSRQLTDLLTEFCRKNEIKISAEARHFLLENLGNDRMITLQELEKLALYTRGAGEITLNHCLESVTSAPSVSVFSLCDAIADRRPAEVEKSLTALEEEGEDIQQSLAMVLRHFRRLLEAREKMDEGRSLDEALGSLRPPVRFGQREFAAQVKNYPPARLKKCYSHFYELYSRSRQGGGQEARTAIKRALLALSA